MTQAQRQTEIQPIITSLDRSRLYAMLEDDRYLPKVVSILEDKLANAVVVDPYEVPEDLVTMNSRVEWSMGKGVKDSVLARELTLSYPHTSSIEAGRISIFAPLGIALLGLRTGQEAQWSSLDGTPKSLIVERLIYQPEAHGDLHL